ncbi:hypothetical protein [Bartonella sp. AD13SXNS]|uniref:hypothetical protein n=1 Tax=Bartonella sp. AD13SXNS TaxID=3243462 RepID=UPI0035D0867B
MWGELGGAWWAQNGLIDFYSAWASFSQKNCFIGLDCWEKQGGEGVFPLYGVNLVGPGGRKMGLSISIVHGLPFLKRTVL